MVCQLKKMKKMNFNFSKNLVLSLLSLVVFALISCGGESATSTSTTSSSSEISTSGGTSGVSSSGITSGSTSGTSSSDVSSSGGTSGTTSGTSSSVTSSGSTSGSVIGDPNVGSGVTKANAISDFTGLTNGMVLIPSKDQTYQRGIPVSDDNEDTDYRSQPVHDVTLTYDFYMNEAQVTVKEFNEVINYALNNGYAKVVQYTDGILKARLYSIGATASDTTMLYDTHDNDSRGNPNTIISYNGSEREFEPLASTQYNTYPIFGINWYAAAFYSNIKSIMNGLDAVYDVNTWATDFSKNGYRLATEAEWEFALRGGNSYKYFWGSDAGYLGRYVYQGSWVTNVMSLQANPYGLYDMLGDPDEYMNDYWGEYTAEAKVNPTGPAVGTKERGNGEVSLSYFRVFRGGGADYPNTIQSGYRWNSSEGGKGNSTHSFRIVLPKF